jgi:hypothetical protein
MHLKRNWKNWTSFTRTVIPIVPPTNNYLIQAYKSKSRRMRWARHVAPMGEKRTPYRILMGKPGGKKPL